MANRKILLGARLKELRKAAGLSQEELSVKIGIEAKYLSRIETAGCYPSVLVLEKVAEALEIEMLELFNFSHLDNDAVSQRGIESILKRASQEERQLIHKLIKAVCQ
jgi:transcriptional regulator with XRE-family HTH domain